MSISNLFAPNDYDIFVNSIVTGGDILTNNIDTIGVGDTLLIAPVKAGAVRLGHPGAPTTINGTGTNVFSSNGNIVIDDSASNVSALFLGNANMASVVIGKPTGFARFQSPVFFSAGTGSLDSLSGMPDISGTGSGCIGNTPNFVLIEAFKLNLTVFLRWKFIFASPLVCIANSALTIVEPIPVGFRPVTEATSSAIACKTAVPNTSLPALIRISTAGAISFELQTATNLPTNFGIWVAAEFCSIYGGCMEYESI